ncbi:hypothetical protein BKA62DRAFT_244903 [Auriculariales sp. MPI-PUGE-AT-0066]|nr:hypothetical protein BKA62DRAFT_244903 [Auriculariales sp. MPI-PUGE-AT-0066]
MGITFARLLQSNHQPIDLLPNELLVLLFEWIALLNPAPNIPLLRVNRRIRAIALDTPALWSTITLYGRKPLEGLEPLLLLAGPDAPLVLDIDVAGEASYPGTSVAAKRSDDIGILLLANMRRVKGLTLRFHPFQRQSFEPLFSSFAPLLESITLMCGGAANLSVIDAPRLRRVEVDRMQLGPRFVMAPGTDIQTVVLRDVQLDFDELRELITSAPQLRRLELYEVGFAPTWHAVGTVIDLREHGDNLRELIVHHPSLSANAPVLADLFNALHLPNLSIIDITLVPSESTLSGETEALIRGLQPTTIEVTRTIAVDATSHRSRARPQDKIWTVAFGPVVFSFPQLVAGRVLALVLELAAPTVRVWEADEAFLAQFVRRRTAGALPPMPKFEKIVLVQADDGTSPSLELAEEALAACLEARSFVRDVE